MSMSELIAASDPSAIGFLFGMVFGLALSALISAIR